MLTCNYYIVYCKSAKDADFSVHIRYTKGYLCIIPYLSSINLLDYKNHLTMHKYIKTYCEFYTGKKKPKRLA